MMCTFKTCFIPVLSADSQAFLYVPSLIIVVVPLGWEPGNSVWASGAPSACTTNAFIHKHFWLLVFSQGLAHIFPWFSWQRFVPLLLAPISLPCCHSCPHRAHSHPAQPPAGAGAGVKYFFHHLCWISALCYNWFFADVMKQAAFPPWMSVSIRDSVTSIRNPSSAELCRTSTVTVFFFPSFYFLPPPGPFSSTNGEISFKLGLD